MTVRIILKIFLERKRREFFKIMTREALYRVNKSKTKQETWHKTQSEGVRLLSQ
jgi:hypothetical protein